MKNFHESIDYYLKLGLRLIVSDKDRYARFELPSGSATFSILLAEQPKVGDTILYFEVEDVDATYAKLCDQGIAFDTEPTDQPYRWRTAHFRDPTGHKLALFHAGNDRRFPPWRLKN